MAPEQARGETDREAPGRRDDALVPFREAFRLDCKNHLVGSVPYSLAHILRVLGRPDEANEAGNR